MKSIQPPLAAIFYDLFLQGQGWGMAPSAPPICYWENGVYQNVTPTGRVTITLALIGRNMWQRNRLLMASTIELRLCD